MSRERCVRAYALGVLQVHEMDVLTATPVNLLVLVLVARAHAR